MQKTAPRRLPARHDPGGASECRASAFVICVPSLSRSMLRGAEGTSVLGDRAQIADEVRGPRADASESTRRAVCAAPCLSLHVKCLASGLAFCVAAQGHAARRRLSERYTKRYAGRGGVSLGCPASARAQERLELQGLDRTAEVIPLRV